MKKKDVASAFLRNGIPLAIWLLVLLLGFTISAVAQKPVVPPAGTEKEAPPSPRAIIESYVPSGFSVEGPIVVLEITPKTLSLLTGIESRPLVLKIEGMQINVRDANNKSLSLGDIQKGTTVYLSRKPGTSQMFIFVVPRKESPKNA
ncbi:MAG: hypothetical protein HY914_19410 [Desulfomonile tiedjei]|nr:hypothetical protein [Desulfomonile tiedjei]